VERSGAIRLRGVHVRFLLDQRAHRRLVAARGGVRYVTLPRRGALRHEGHGADRHDGHEE
jgi:hypothetical protein